MTQPETHQATLAGTLLAGAATLLLVSKLLDLLEPLFGIDLVSFAVAGLLAGSFVTLALVAGYDVQEWGRLRSAWVSRSFATCSFALVAASVLVVIAIEHVGHPLGTDSWVGVAGAALMLAGAVANRNRRVRQR